MHQKNKMGNVELATVSFGQSFQITPIQLAATVSGIINGGKRVTPHFAVAVQSPDGRNIKELSYPVEQGILSEETSRRVRNILEKVVSEGSGKNAKIEGYSIGGKTATSQTLPESAFYPFSGNVPYQTGCLHIQAPPVFPAGLQHH